MRVEKVPDFKLPISFLRLAVGWVFRFFNNLLRLLIFSLMCFGKGSGIRLLLNVTYGTILSTILIKTFSK